MVEGQPVFMITGQVAAGKSTVARALLARFDHGLHIDHDGMREMVVSGLASPLDPGPETHRQFRLAMVGAVALATTYHEAGFAVAIEGAFDPWHAEETLVEAGIDGAMVGVELHPSLEATLERNRSRTTKSYDTSILEDAIREIDGFLRAEPPPPGWARIDNTSQSIDETADEIMRLIPT